MDLEREALELKRSLAEYLEKMVQALPSIISDYRFGKEDKANEQMLLLVEGLIWTCDAVNLTKDYHGISLVSMRELLEELNEALANGDKVLTADLLEYEMMPKINEWREQILTEKNDVC
ncbi:MAG: hypothetical protein Q4A78_09115 [Peptostreptococcaceae bacterium]|nr:hypothetical protein [Peptostreptococcaceae bacterium]